MLPEWRPRLVAGLIFIAIGLGILGGQSAAWLTSGHWTEVLLWDVLAWFRITVSSAGWPVDEILSATLDIPLCLVPFLIGACYTATGIAAYIRAQPHAQIMRSLGRD